MKELFKSDPKKCGYLRIHAIIAALIVVVLLYFFMSKIVAGLFALGFIFFLFQFNHFIPSVIITDESVKYRSLHDMSMGQIEIPIPEIESFRLEPSVFNIYYIQLKTPKSLLGGQTLQMTKEEAFLAKSIFKSLGLKEEQRKT